MAKVRQEQLLDVPALPVDQRPPPRVRYQCRQCDRLRTMSHTYHGATPPPPQYECSPLGRRQLTSAACQRFRSKVGVGFGG